MASTTYTGAASVTTAYAAADVYTLNISPASITNIAQSGANVVITTGGTSFTITGVTLAALATTNFALQGGGSVTLGDGTVATGTDDAGNTITGSSVADILLGLGGADTIDGGLGNNLIIGGNGFSDSVDAGDNLIAAGGNDTIYANGGNDTINSGSGLDVVFGGLGNDVINVIPNLGQTATVYGGGGVNDTLDTGVDTITVGASGATVAGAAVIYANAGADIVNVFSTGNNSVYGGLGNDSITINGGGNNFVAGGTNDTDTIVINGNGNNTVFGGFGVNDTTDLADTITITNTGTTGSNLVYGNGGNDVISISGGAGSTVYGGLGNDSITVGGGNNQVFGGSVDTDTIVVNGDGNNTIYGGFGETDTTDLADNILISGTGNNVVYGNAGDDVVNVVGFPNNTTLGSNTVYGGLGNDTINVVGGQAAGANGTGAASSLFVQGGTGSDLINLSGVLGGTSTVYGGNSINDSVDGADVIRGGASNDLIYGNGGADVITSGAGADTIFGGAGVDRILINGAGNKLIGGNETGEQVFVANQAAADFTAATVAGGNVVITQTTGGRTITFDAPNSLVNLGFNAQDEATFIAGAAPATSVLLANFGTTAATLTGTTGVDVIYSGGAADTIIGGTGADSIFAGGGNDVITLDGLDVIQAGDGNDTVNVGLLADLGANLVVGGAGTDVINFTVAVNGTLGTGLSGFEQINLTNASNSITTVTQNVANGETLFINGGNLTGANALTFVGTAETDGGKFSVVGGAGADQIQGGTGADTISTGDGADFVTVSGGGDVINLGAGDDFVSSTVANLSATGFSLDGGVGADTLTLTDGGALTLSANVTNIETIITSNFVTSITTNTANVSAGQTLFVNGAANTTSALTFNGAAETDGGAFRIIGGGVADTITTGTGNDTITAGVGADRINVGTGIDTVIQGLGDSGTYTTQANNNPVSTSTFDVVTGASAGDRIDLTDVARTVTFSNSLNTTASGDNGAAFVRGTYNAATSTFVGSATGTDSLFVYDADAAIGTTAQEAVVLVGFAGTATGAAGADGIFTLA